MKRREERPIARQILGSLPPLTVLIMAIAVLTLWISGSQEVRHQARTATRPVAEALSYAVMPFITVGDSTSLQRLVDQISANRAVASIAVYDATATPLAMTLEKEPFVTPEQVRAFVSRRPQFPETVSTDTGVGAVLHPVFTRQYNAVDRTNLAAVVVVEPRVDYFWASYRKLSYETAGLLFLSLLISLALGYFGLRRLVLAPLAKITRAADERNRSILDGIAADPGSSEFGTLVGALLGMIGQIEEKNRMLQRHAQELEVAVHERTKELEESLQRLQSAKDLMVRQEKLASLGRLSAGIAHEINNPAGFVHSNLQTLSEYNQEVLENLNAATHLVRHLEAGEIEEAREVSGRLRRRQDEVDFDFIREDARDIIDSSLKGMRRIADIVKHLQRFSRRDESQAEGVHVGLAIDEALELMHNELKYNHTVELALADCPEVRGNQGQMAQVFVNLLMNAKQAMPEGGTIRISQECNEQSVVTTVSDTGAGIPGEIIDRIFDPFFTTKPVGVGTGLGLSIVHSIVESCDGTIEVQSEPGRGTTFRLSLPISQRENANYAATEYLETHSSS